MDRKRTGESLKELFKGEIGSKASKRQRGKAVKREEVKKKHTIYLLPEQSKKLRLYAAEKEKSLSDIVEQLIAKHL